MAAYSVKVLDDRGQLIVGATLNCSDDASAAAKFAQLQLPDGEAELWCGQRLVLRRLAAAKRA